MTALNLPGPNFKFCRSISQLHDDWSEEYVGFDHTKSMDEDTANGTGEIENIADDEF